MARYWVYLNDQVIGPFPVEQLIRMKSFSRQTPVCIDDHSGKPGEWITPAEIPELAAVFKVVDQYHEIPSPRASKPAPKPSPARPAPARVPRTRAPEAEAPRQKSRSHLLWILIPFALLAATIFAWWMSNHQKQMLREEQAEARRLVEDLPLPGTYSSFGQYLSAKQIRPRWEFERTPADLLNTTVSWFGDGKNASVSMVYAFEVNLQAQTARPLNSAAARVVAEGFSAPAAPKSAAPAPKPKSAADRFQSALSERRGAVEKGDFSAVWNSFSQRKRDAMLKAGISETGFVRLQTLTRGLESEVNQTVVKTHTQEDGSMLVLLRQSQSKHPDLFLKQHWVQEDGAWKLDEEDKRSAEPVAASSPDTSEPAAPAPAGDQASSRPAPAAPSSVPIMKLPGLSN